MSMQVSSRAIVFDGSVTVATLLKLHSLDAWVDLAELVRRLTMASPARRVASPVHCDNEDNRAVPKTESVVTDDRCVQGVFEWAN